MEKTTDRETRDAGHGGARTREAEGSPGGGEGDPGRQPCPRCAGTRPSRVAALRAVGEAVQGDDVAGRSDVLEDTQQDETREKLGTGFTTMLRCCVFLGKWKNPFIKETTVYKTVSCDLHVPP